MKAEVGFKLLGNYFAFSCGGQEKLGRLVQIRIDSNERMIVGIDEDGFIEEYEISQINIVKKNNSQSNLTKQIIKQVNKDINSFKYDLGEYRKEDFIEILMQLHDSDLRDNIIACLDGSNLYAGLNKLYDSVMQQNLGIEDKELVCGILAYKQHDSEMAYKVFSNRWLVDKADSDKMRDFILVADEFDNDVLCFYLLNEFFSANGRYIGDNYYANLWWKYLYYAIKYNNFDLINEMDVNEWNVRFLIDSFIYIFHMYNMQHLAVELSNRFSRGNNSILQRNNEDFKDLQETIDEVNLMKNYLPDTAEGYYLRFKGCMERILQSNHIRDTESDEKDGYI